MRNSKKLWSIQCGLLFSTSKKDLTLGKISQGQQKAHSWHQSNPPTKYQVSLPGLVVLEFLSWNGCKINCFDIGKNIFSPNFHLGNGRTNLSEFFLKKIQPETDTQHEKVQPEWLQFCISSSSQCIQRWVDILTNNTRSYLYSDKKYFCSHIVLCLFPDLSSLFCILLLKGPFTMVTLSLLSEGHHHRMQCHLETPKDNPLMTKSGYWRAVQVLCSFPLSAQYSWLHSIPDPKARNWVWIIKSWIRIFIHSTRTRAAGWPAYVWCEPINLF